MTGEGSRPRWAALLGKFLGVNVVVQAVALVVGILVVRGLPQESYGYYAVVTSLLAAFVLLSDSGLTGSFIAAAAPDRNDPVRVGALLRSSLRLQRAVAVLIGAVIVLTLTVVLTLLSAPVPVIVGASIALSLCFLPLANKSMYQGLHRLVGAYSRLQRAALITALFRLTAIGTVTLVFGLNLFAALLVLVLAAFVEALAMQWGTRRIYPQKASSDTDLRSSQLAAIRHTMPASLTIVAQTQLVTLVIGVVGGAIVLAEISALSRFALVLAVFAGVATDLGLGAVARAGYENRKVVRTIAVVLSAFLAIGALAVVALWLFAPQLLWLLGPDYEGLELSLVIVGVGTVGIMAADLLRQLNQARGWMKWSWVYVPLTAAWLVAGLFLLDLSQVDQAAVWMALQAVTGGLTQLVVLAFAVARGSRGDAAA